MMPQHSIAPMHPADFAYWLMCGERGISSEAIASHLSGTPTHWRWGSDYPNDPDDFRRCQLLLGVVPEARQHLGHMATRSPEWARLVESWDAIDAAIRDEVPNYLDRRARGSAHKGYVLMRMVIDDGEPCLDCSGSGRVSTCDKCRGTGKRAGGRCRAAGCFSGYHLCGGCRGNGYVKKSSVR